ncbi:MAG: IS1595 family transposase [Acidimicrobiales bacterium]
MEKITFGNLALRISSEADAYEYLETLRWPEQPVCPHCGSINDHYFLKPSNGVSRATTRGSVSERRVWKCKDCRKQFSVTTGTVFHGSKVSLRIWLFVFFEMCANKNGIAAREIARKYGVAPKTAWFMTQRIREAMANDSSGKLSGNIVMDETYIGGKPENWHANDPRRAAKGNSTNKIAAIALISDETGEIRTKAVTNVTGSVIQDMVRQNVVPSTTTLHSDSAPLYRTISKEMAGHHVVNHHAGQYITALSDGTNKAENFFSQLKRSIDGTHHCVSKEHLGRYLSEFAFRHGSHEMSDTERMVKLMSQVPGVRLSYRPVALS